jgi:MFS family permease
MSGRDVAVTLPADADRASTPNGQQPPGEARTGTFRALRHRNYRLWFVGQGVSLVGTWMQTMAQQLLIYQLTGSAAALGMINFIGLIPLLPLALWGGSIVDRFPKRTVILVTQTGMLIQALLLSALTISGTIQVWQVYVMAFFLGALQAVDMPARQAFTVDMVEGKEDLTNAIGLNSAMFNGARALGPALAGLVVAATGEGLAFFINALTFVAVIVCLLMMRNLPNSSKQTTVGVAKHMAEGIRFVSRQQVVLVLMSLVAVSAFLSMPYSTLMPIFANDVLRDSANIHVQTVCHGPSAILRCQAPEALSLGLLLTTVGIGALVGALTIASLPNDARRGRLLTAGNLLFPASLLLFASSRSFLLSILYLLMVGISFVAQNALANTLIQISTPDSMRGRVMSLYSLTTQSMMRMGALQAGLLADRIGVPLAIGLGASVSLVYGPFVAVRYPRVREMR